MDSLLNPASLSAATEALSPPSLRIRAPISSDENEPLLVLEEEEEEEEAAELAEEFNTASDADEESVGSSEVIVLPKGAGLPSNSWMPKAKPSGDGESDEELVEEDEENELYEDFDEIYDAMSVEDGLGDGSPSENFNIEDGSRDVITGVEEKEPAQDDTLQRTEEERQIEDEGATEDEKVENFPIELGEISSPGIKAVPLVDTLEKEPVDIHSMDGHITEASPGKGDVMSSSSTEGPFDVVDDKVAVIAFEAGSEIVDVPANFEGVHSSVHEIRKNIQKTELDVNAPEVHCDNTSVPVSDLDGSVPYEQSLSATANESEREELEVKGDESKDSKAQAPSLVPDDLVKSRTFLASEAIKEMLQEVEGLPNGSADSKFDSSKDIDGKIVSDSDEDTVSNVEDPNQIMDVEALVALLKSASSSTADGRIVATSLDSYRSALHDLPTGLGSSFQPLKPPMHLLRANPVPSSEVAVTPEPDNNMTEEQKKLHEKIEQLKVMFLRLVHRLGLSPEDPLVIQVLYHLSFAEGIHSGTQRRQPFNNIESAKRLALQLEENGKESLDFSCNILIIGKSGVGKSATINSIFGEEMTQTSAFEPATSSVKGISGMVDGIKIHVMDTPGLRAATMDQGSSRRMLTSIKKNTKRNPPEIVLYVDRLDTAGRDQNDLPLLKSITSTMGVSVWSNAIIVLTHAGSAPPEGPMGSPLSYEVFVAKRTHAVQQSIRIAAGDMRLMNPVALVENHQSCRRNREGQGMLPNGVIWRPQLLLLCVSSKIISEVNSLLKLQDSSPAKLFGLQTLFPPLPFLLSSLLQPREHPKLPTDQRVDNDIFDVDSDDLSDEEEENGYDQLPPFKPLRKLQIAKLTKEQKRAYYDEYDYRVKLLQKKQWKDELKRRQGFGDDEMVEDFYYDDAPATVPNPMPDMVLPPSFDCDAPTYRYRFLGPTSHLQVRPVLDAHGWDHDCGFDGLNLEENLAFAGRFPTVLSAQVTKDKREFSIHVDSCIAAKHGEVGSTLTGLNIQAIGKQLAYTMRGETKRKTSKKNKTTGGISVTFLGKTITTGLKFEDQLSIGKQLSVTATTGAVRAQGDIAYGINLEARLRDKEYPISQGLSTLVISLMRMRNNSILGANFQTQSPVGRHSKVVVRVGLNNKMNGQIIIRMSTSENLQIALVGIIPIALSMLKSMIYGDETTY
ncbi:translocase of chloroplast 101, chloroplastic-like [Zingiber officinale]|nr:translocase of chloroplast 101, chloroplastic-like [Zingiber officinale]